MNIEYRKLKRYKYQLTESYKKLIPISYPMAGYETKYRWVALRNSTIFIKKGYCWDGPSGPTIDTENFITESSIETNGY